MRSTFKVLFYLKYGTPVLDGKLPLMCRVTVDGKSTSFSCKIGVPVESWDPGKARLVADDKVSRSMNSVLNSMDAKLHAIYFDLMHTRGYATPVAIKTAFLGLEMKQDNLLKFFEGHLEMLSREVGYRYSKSTFLRYSIVFRHLSAFLKDVYGVADCPFDRVDVEFLNRFSNYLMKQKRCESNTVWCYMGALKHILILAQGDGLMQKNPFAGYTNHYTQVNRGYLTKEEIVKVAKYVAKSRIDELVRDLFLFSCFTGLAYTDIKHLTKNHLQKQEDGNTWIMLRRHKTNTLSMVRLLDTPYAILKKHATRRKYIFPIPSDNCCNEHLQQIGKKCKIGVHLTFHVARHTFATLSLNEGMPIESLSEILGHTNIRTTQIYAKITHQKLTKDFEAFSKSIAGLEAEIKDKTDRKG